MQLRGRRRVGSSEVNREPVGGVNRCRTDAEWALEQQTERKSVGFAVDVSTLSKDTVCWYG